MSNLNQEEYQEKKYEEKKEELEKLGVLPDTILVIVDNDNKFIELENDSNGYIVYKQKDPELMKVIALLGGL